MVEEIGPWAAPIFCPVFILSPTLTTSLAGTPVCWDRGMTTFLGRGNSWMGFWEVIFSSGGWTPPRKVLILMTLITADIDADTQCTSLALRR